MKEKIGLEGKDAVKSGLFPSQSEIKKGKH